MKIGVIGCGYWGPNLIRNFYQNPDCTMAICCDFDERKLDRMKKLFPDIQTTQNADDILLDESIDAVAIATPVSHHYALGQRALEHDKHIFIEKPLAASEFECNQLIKLAEERKRVLMVGHTFEYAAAVLKTKEIIDSGELGEVMYISSSRLNLGLFQPDINVMWDLAPHDISIILYLLGMEPTAVNGQGKAHFFDEIEDVASATLHFPNKVIAFVHTSWLDPYKVRKMTIVGTRKMLVYDDIQPNEKIKIFDKGVDSPSQYDTFGEFQFSYRYGDIFSPRIDEHEPLKLECAHFLESIREDKAPKTDGHAGKRVVQILVAITTSMKQDGRLIKLNGESSSNGVQAKADDIAAAAVSR